MAAFSNDNASGFPVIATLLPVGGAFALLAAGTATERNVASRLLSVRPAVWVGDLSYSWYLWHWPLIVFATVLWPGAGWTALSLAAVSLLPAWLSYRYVENPIRLDSRIVGRRVFALLAVCVVVPLAASLGLRETGKALASTSRVKAFERSQTAHLDVAAGCESSPLDDPPACTWGKKRRQGQVVLLGDSNAGQFSEAVVRAAQRANLQARISTKAYCPFIDLSVLRDDRTWEQKECRDLYERNLATLVRSRPNLVVLAARTDMYLDGSEFGLARTDTGSHVHGTAAKERLWSQGLQSTIRRLNRDGIAVVVVHPVPELPYSVDDCAVIRILTKSCASSIARSDVDQTSRARSRSRTTPPTPIRRRNDRHSRRAMRRPGMPRPSRRHRPLPGQHAPQRRRHAPTDRRLLRRDHRSCASLAPVMTEVVAHGPRTFSLPT